MTETTATLVGSSDRTLAWLEQLRSRLSGFGYSESRHWAAFRDSVANSAIAYLNVNKASMRLFVRLRTEEHNLLVQSPSSSSWAKRFPSVFRIAASSDLETAAQLILLSGAIPGERVEILHAEAADYSGKELDRAILSDRLQLGCVPTDTEIARVRQRRGQDRVRRLTLKNYGSRCALCDVLVPELLVASHIVGWAEDAATRGILSNVVCLCVFHDSLFEMGYWSLTDSLQVVRRSSLEGQTVQSLLPEGIAFRRPAHHSPRAEFLERHRQRVGL